MIIWILNQTVSTKTCAFRNFSANYLVTVVGINIEIPKKIFFIAL